MFPQGPLSPAASHLPLNSPRLIPASRRRKSPALFFSITWSPAPQQRFLDLPLDWIPTTWIYKGGDLRYALNYGEVRFDVLQQFFADSASEWSHKGEGN